jgi:hypothetical protein
LWRLAGRLHVCCRESGNWCRSGIDHLPAQAHCIIEL